MIKKCNNSAPWIINLWNPSPNWEILLSWLPASSEIPLGSFGNPRDSFRARSQPLIEWSSDGIELHRARDAAAPLITHIWNLAPNCEIQLWLQIQRGGERDQPIGEPVAATAPNANYSKHYSSAQLVLRRSRSSNGPSDLRPRRS